MTLLKKMEMEKNHI